MTGGGQRKIVLVVEDDASVRQLLVRALSPHYEVRQAADGLEAATKLTESPPADLLICDVMMPHIDGFTLAKVARESPELHAVPIIFLTAKTTPQAVIKGIELGARHYVQKPFSVKDLLEKVAKILK